MIGDDEGSVWSWPPIRTVTDLALHHINLKLACSVCNSVRVLHGAGVMELCRRRGWSDELETVARHFRCTRCWVHERKIVRPRVFRTNDAPSGEPLPLPDEREWKRLTSRYRN